jgi:hypothetical protein
MIMPITVAIARPSISTTSPAGDSVIPVRGVHSARPYERRWNALDVDEDEDELLGRGSRVGQTCDCPAQVVGRDTCAWCGGSYPPLDEATRRAVERVRQRLAEDAKGVADL